MVKMGGFSDHSHNKAPCTKCTVSQKHLTLVRSLTNGEQPVLICVCLPLLTDFPARSGTTHQKNCTSYFKLPQSQREAFFTRTGARWSEFARLPYFDLVRHTIIDPMHNCLLGEVIALNSAIITNTSQRGRKKSVVYSMD